MSISGPEDDLRDVLTPTPANAPADIDSTIRAHAREAVLTHPTTSSSHGVGLRGWLLRTLPIAAVVVVAVGLIPRMQQEPASGVSEIASDLSQGDVGESAAGRARSTSEQREEIAPESAAGSDAAALASTSAALRDLAEHAPQRQSMKSEADIDVEAIGTEDAVDSVDLDAMAKRADEGNAFVAAEAEPIAPAAAPLAAPASPALLRESNGAAAGDIMPEAVRTGVTAIVELLRSGDEVAARDAYRRLRQAWPDVEPVPDLHGISDAEIDWFVAEAEAFEDVP